MKALYITSLVNFSGKTAVTLAIGKHFQDAGRSVGYLKPVSYQPTTVAGQTVDEDAAFVKSVLGLQANETELAPVIVTPQTLNDCLAGGCDYDNIVKDAVEQAGEGVDLLLLEGGGSLREGYAIGQPTARVAEELDAPVLAIVKFRGRMRLLDDALAAQFRLGDRLLGVILNRIPDTRMDFVKDHAIPFLKSRGIIVLGVLPERPRLAAISVGELREVLDAEQLAANGQDDLLIESLTVGAMGGQEALSRLRRYQNKAVITGGDRTDVLLAALDTSTNALVLTGNLHPAPVVLERAEEQKVPVLLVTSNTIETVEAIENVFGKTRLGLPEKLDAFRSLMAERLDYDQLNKLLGMS